MVRAVARASPNTTRTRFLYRTRRHTVTSEKTTGFDLDAWLGNASRPEREVTLYATNALQGDIDRAERDRAAILEEAERDRAGKAKSWGDDGSPENDSRVQKLDAELKRLRAQIAKTALVFRLRSIDSDEIDAINRKHPLEKGADEATKSEVGLARLMEQLATQVFSPRVFTADELTRLRKAVGEPEFNKLMVAMNEVGSATAAASTPFWRGNSGARQS